MPINIFHPDQIRRIEKQTMIDQNISAELLMERAGQVFTDWFIQKFQNTEIHIFCGQGNNGGDGLVIGRFLSFCFYNVNLWIVPWESSASPEFTINFNKLNTRQGIEIFQNFEFDSISKIPSEAIIIDAILGTGTNRPVEGKMAQIIDKINALPNLKVSVDIPSGLSTSEITEGVAIKADWTLGFEYPKLAFLFPENQDCVKNWEVESIALSKNAELLETPAFRITDQNDLSKIYQPRKRFSYKHQYGHALIVAGSSNMCGAGILAATSCLRSGAGLVSLATQESCKASLFAQQAEIMFCPTELIFQDQRKHYQAICMGPGLDEDVVEYFLNHPIPDIPLLIDAEGIQFLAQNPRFFSKLPNQCVFTPHLGELSLLLGLKDDFYSMFQAAIDWCKDTGKHMVLKGAYTACIAPNGEVWFNQTGNPGLATAGSGDVLSGIITGLLAQSYPMLDAMRLGVWLHGKAADLALELQSYESLSAGDVSAFLGRSYKELLEV